MVQRFLVSNRTNWLVIKTDGKTQDRVITITEPRSQLLDHVMLQNYEPSKNKTHWSKLNKLNTEKNKKNHLKVYEYNRQQFEYVRRGTKNQNNNNKSAKKRKNNNDNANNESKKPKKGEGEEN